MLQYLRTQKWRGQPYFYPHRAYKLGRNCKSQNLPRGQACDGKQWGRVNGSIIHFLILDKKKNREIFLYLKNISTGLGDVAQWQSSWLAFHRLRVWYLALQKTKLNVCVCVWEREWEREKEREREEHGMMIKSNQTLRLHLKGNNRGNKLRHMSQLTGQPHSSPICYHMDSWECGIAKVSIYKRKGDSRVFLNCSLFKWRFKCLNDPPYKSRKTDQCT
jgi:hypothetical protein